MPGKDDLGGSYLWVRGRLAEPRRKRTVRAADSSPLCRNFSISRPRSCDSDHCAVKFGDHEEALFLEYRSSTLDVVGKALVGEGVVIAKERCAEELD